MNPKPLCRPRRQFIASVRCPGPYRMCWRASPAPGALPDRNTALALPCRNSLPADGQTSDFLDNYLVWKDFARVRARRAGLRESEQI